MSDPKTPYTPSKTSRLGYYPILDALRFVLAFWVAVGHYEMIPLFGSPSTGTGLWVVFKHGWSTFVFGTPAVIVFFVISGFCIHLPFRGTSKIDVPRYYLRRYTRILIPVAAALVVYRLTGAKLTLRGEHSILWDSPLWSLACEEIYYAMYPVLRWARNAIGWGKLLTVSFVVGITVSSSHPRADSWHAYGPFGTAMILLPVWLLGCLLAEQVDSLAERARDISIWYWRFLAWLGCWTAEMMHFKLHVPYTQTMLWFGVLAYFWVRREIAHGKNIAPNRLLVASGAWSYSLYLMHWVGETFASRLRPDKLDSIPDWFLVIASGLLVSYIFYLLVERPSHNLARKIRVQGGRRKTEQTQEADSAPGKVDPVPEHPVQA
jgi:peptidoglycan/LPS O-acetylase OafA/YrhL